MASIRQRIDSQGKIKFHVQIRLHGHPTETATFDRKTDAKKWAAKTESDIREGRHFRGSEARRHTLSDAIARYQTEILPRKPRTGKIQKPQLEWWRARIGDYTLAKITPALIVETRAALAQETSATNANRYCAVLSHLFTVCVREWGWADDTPFRKVSRLQEPRGRVRYLSEDERAALLKACEASPNPNLYDAVIVALATGCRKNEVLSLKWSDVDFERGQIVLLETKNKTARAVPLAGFALERMRARYAARRSETYCFPYPTIDKPADVDRDFARARAAAKIEDFRFHDLRHSTASYLAMGGASLPEIAAVLGHKTFSMVQRYAHLSPAHTAAVVARMNSRIFGYDEVTDNGQ